MSWFARHGESISTLKTGDHIVVNARPSLDPAHELAALREVRRPSDGWTWQINPGPVPR